jgi:GNAT superfamily N-acetyltransferase
MSIRLAEAADLPCLQLLATQVFVDTYAVDGIGASLAREVQQRLSLPAFGAELSTPGSHVRVADRDGRLLAFAHVIVGAAHPLDGTPSAELRRLYVQRAAFGQGLGTRLLRDAEAHAAGSGATMLWLTAWAGNARALAFYARCGYADQGSIDHVFEAERFENRVLARSLR